ncbi:hypothetical protein B0H16DRAFT_1530468 [Mycena metata]|uniref:Uncharacterized protein n=1 Tax=Mycena metata TaxID=1033252 RepID=A0AAD7JC44_9AGAR|nr:hypothetical protein B0H16DRAFT_1530468 [Mycena metata]
MLAPDSPCLVIFGSIHDGWVLKAAKLLADESQFAVMIRPLRDDPLLVWEGTDSPSRVAGLSNLDSLQTITETDHETDEEEEYSDSEPEENTSSTDNDVGGTLRLRGGAVADYNPWLGPVHDVDVRLDLGPTIGDIYQVDLLTRIQFKTQAEYESKGNDGYRPQIVAWVKFSLHLRSGKSVIPDRSYSDISFLVECQEISSCHQLECNDFIPPRHTRKTVNTASQGSSTTMGLTAGVSIPGHGTAAAKMEHTSSKSETKVVENQNDRVTPKCIVRYQQGRRLKIKHTSCDSYKIAYEAAEDLNNEGTKYPMDVEFSVGIHVIDPETANNPALSVPGIPDLPETSFLIMNQTNLWVNSGDQTERQGILVLTVAHIPDVHTRDKVYVSESQEVKLGKGSITHTPTNAQPAPYSAKMSVSGVVHPRRAEPKEPGRVKKFLNKVAVKSFLRRKTVPPNPIIETLFMHEFISRGWDLRLNQWREQMYPPLVGRFKFFTSIYGEKCCLFFRHFSPKKEVKNLKLFHHYFKWNSR